MSLWRMSVEIEWTRSEFELAAKPLSVLGHPEQGLSPDYSVALLV
jgi:hypothetical protein